MSSARGDRQLPGLVPAHALQSAPLRTRAAVIAYICIKMIYDTHLGGPRHDQTA